MAIPPSWVRFLDGYTKLYKKMDENEVMTILKYGYIMAYHPISEKKTWWNICQKNPTHIPHTSHEIPIFFQDGAPQ